MKRHYTEVFVVTLGSAGILTNNIPLGWSAVLSTLVRFFQIPLKQ